MCERNKMALIDNVQAGNLGENLYKLLETSKVLVVGAGGIGCELLKTLVLTGFNDIEVIDLDTIDVSNLNRQFLFQKQHVGKSKASVARESAIQFNPKANIKAYHDSITSPDYDVNFFRQFSVVLNALDNRSARNHVNRMCLAADVPLIESGSAGYLGQVTVIKKGETECYECQPKPHQKSYPGCTIRNTPSEPIHCIVWAKHLFNQLFGEADADEEVSPDTEDPEAGGVAGERANNQTSGDEIQRTSTQEWAKIIDYDAAKLVNKLFVEDIKYLLSMDKLWKDRKPPVPLDLFNLEETTIFNNLLGLPDQKIWSIKECVEKFGDCVNQLKMVLAKKGDYLVWDKDDNSSLDFVVSACNLRAHIFSIQRKSRFDVKSMAGNIIPAIATTNAVIAGLIVLEAMKAINNDIKSCRTTYLNKMPSFRKKLLQPSCLIPPNTKCYVCSSKPEATVVMDCSKITLKVFEEKLLKHEFGVIAPDVEIEDGKGTILISSEEGETEQNMSKLLKDFKIGNGSRLKVDDFQQNYQLVVNIQQCDNMQDDHEFKVIEDVEKLVENKEVVAPQQDGVTLDRKRKASHTFEEGECSKAKHARVDTIDGVPTNSEKSRAQNSVKSNLNNSTPAPVVMVIDENDDVVENKNDQLNVDKAQLESENKESENNRQVVVILDDDNENDNGCYNSYAISKNVSSDQIIIDCDDNSDNDIIVL